MKIIRSALLTLTVYGTLGWMYIALNAAMHPITLAMPLTHLMSWPREDTFGIICFGVSFVSFFVWNLVREEKS
jgi:hypothetical protein